MGNEATAALQETLDHLQRQLDELKLSTQGPVGPQGEPGPMGPPGKDGSGSSFIPVWKPTGSQTQDTANFKAMMDEPIIELVPGAQYTLGEVECPFTDVHGWGLKKNKINMKGTAVFSGSGNISGVSMAWARASADFFIHQAKGGARIQRLIRQFDGVEIDNGCGAGGILFQALGGVIQNVHYGRMAIQRCKGLTLLASGSGAWLNDVTLEGLWMWACTEFLVGYGNDVECAANRVMEIVMQPDAINPCKCGIKLEGLARYWTIENAAPWDWSGKAVTVDGSVARTLDIGVGAIKGSFRGGWQEKWIDRAGNGTKQAGGYYLTNQGNKVWA